MLKSSYFGFVSGIALFWLNSCGDTASLMPNQDVGELPPDTGGVESYHPVGTETSDLGYILYLPSGVDGDKNQFPLLVYLHGSGERDDTQDSMQALETCARGVVPRMISNHTWKPEFPMIVVSPHSGAGNWTDNGNLLKLRKLIQQLTEQHPVNPERIYMTGYSMGGYGTFSYLAEFGDTAGIAAAVPIAGGGWAPMGKKIKTPVWSFHGAADDVVSLEGDLELIDSINAASPPVPAMITVFDGVGHNAVNLVYNGSGMGTESKDFAPFEQSIFQWMVQFQSN
jgi:predicted peptidase